MARKKYEEDTENHERWMVSYADFITLLFAFFVVMYALSTVNEGKVDQLSNSLGLAFGMARPAIRDQVAPAPVLPRPLSVRPRNTEAMRREREQMTVIARDLQELLAPLVSEGKVRVTQSARGVSVEINASVLFASGDARLTDDAGKNLKTIAAVLARDDHAIQVEGHTDSVPIRNAQFASNWELASARAGSVVRLFVDSGVAETRLAAVGYGPTRPVDSNDTAEGRLRNRRVAVMILSNTPQSVTEIPLERRLPN